MKAPTIFNYGNGQPNTMAVRVNEATFYFSYETLVAFYHPDTGNVTHENIWNNTTGKHLNLIDQGQKKLRVNSEKFNKLLTQIE